MDYHLSPLGPRNSDIGMADIEQLQTLFVCQVKMLFSIRYIVYIIYSTGIIIIIDFKNLRCLTIAYISF